MPTYIPNVTDKQQTDIEIAANDSAIRVESFALTSGQTGTEGTTKMIRAYDLRAQADAGGSPSSAVNVGSAGQKIIGSHNDKPHRFDNPGKA